MENLLSEENQGQKTKRAREITEAIEEMMLNSALLKGSTTCSCSSGTLLMLDVNCESELYVSA